MAAAERAAARGEESELDFEDFGFLDSLVDGDLARFFADLGL